MPKQDAKQSLINAVRELLFEGRPFTVKDITARAYTNVASINYYFGDKNTLINTVVDELIEGYRQTVVETLRRDYDSPADCVETFLNLVAEVYSENKGVIRYLVLENTGNKSKIERFVFDPELMSLVMGKIMQMNSQSSSEEQLCKYLICLSAFVFPLMLEVQNTAVDGGFLSLSALQEGEMRSTFVAQLMKLFR